MAHFNYSHRKDGKSREAYIRELKQRRGGRSEWSPTSPPPLTLFLLKHPER